jgi:hypothetical protein
MREPNVFKRLGGALAAVGLAIAAAFVKGIFSMGLDALGGSASPSASGSSF